MTGSTPARPLRDDIWLLASLAALALLIHLLTLGRYGYFRDELYYVACGRHLDWGYVDHTPFIAVVAAVVRIVLGESLFALRLFPALAHAGLVLTAGLTTRALGGSRFAQGLAALATLAAPVYLGSASILNMNPFDQLLWALCSLLLIQILAREPSRDRGLWILFGVVAGVGLMNKHSMAFFLVAAAIGVALSSERRRLLTPGPWIAASIAALMLSPNLIWQVQHHWPTLEFLRNAAAHKNYSGSIGEFVVAQIMLLQPVSAPLWVLGLGALLFAPWARRFRAIGWGSVIVFVLIVASRGKNYYLAPAYPPLVAAGAVALTRLVTRPRWAWVGPVYASLIAITTIVILPLCVPILPPETYVRYAHALRYEEPRSERHRAARLPQGFADMFGWEEMVATVARVYQTLTPEERARCTIFASNYGEAGAIDLFGPKLGLPRAVSGHNSYWLWGPPDSSKTIVITIGESVEDVGESCARVEQAAVFRHPWNMPYESDLPILIGRDFKMPWREIWPRCKEYI